jgi:hypothetical protein
MSLNARIYLEAFQALIMIMASFGRHLPISGLDHETAQGS